MKEKTWFRDNELIFIKLTRLLRFAMRLNEFVFILSNSSKRPGVAIIIVPPLF
jgi:hypothetical protein